MKMGFLLSVFLVFSSLYPIQHENVLANTFSIKITLQGNDRYEQFEFFRPNEFKYVKDSQVYHGAEAQKAVKLFLENLRLTEETAIDAIISQLKNYGYEKLNRVEIRWFTTKKELYTWVWDSKL